MSRRVIELSELPRCCTDLNMPVEHLFFPELLTPEGREFVEAHDLDSVTLGELRKDVAYMGDGIVKIQHRCSKLADDGSCTIYDERPQLCRQFDCATRSDCVCGGRGFVGAGDVENDDDDDD